MQARTLVHLSDLHFGANPRLEQNCIEWVRQLVEQRVDHVVVTGDITEHGLVSELDRFTEVFEPLATAGRLTVVPGNHDRLGDDVAAQIIGGRRVVARRRPGLHLVQVDSTRSNPGWSFVAHGELTSADLDHIEDAVEDAEPDALVVVLMHHHPLPLPHESALEALGSVLGLPYSASLTAGVELLARLRGHCDLLLHGHRHRPYSTTLAGPRPLGLHNAGCSSALQQAPMFTHMRGRIFGGTQWFAIDRGTTSPRSRECLDPAVNPVVP